MMCEFLFSTIFYFIVTSTINTVTFFQSFVFFFFNDTATTEIYTLSLHDALPIYLRQVPGLADDRELRLREGGRQGLPVPGRDDPVAITPEHQDRDLHPAEAAGQRGVEIGRAHV